MVPFDKIDNHSLRIFLNFSLGWKNYFLLILVMILITLFNYLAIKILGSQKKNIEVEKNLEQEISKQ